MGNSIHKNWSRHSKVRSLNDVNLYSKMHGAQIPFSSRIWIYTTYWMTLRFSQWPTNKNIFSHSVLIQIPAILWLFVITAFLCILDNYVNRRWHIGISVCNEFFDSNKSFHISGHVSKSRWRIRVCLSIWKLKKPHFSVNFRWNFNFFSNNAHKRVLRLQYSCVIFSNFL